MGWILTGNKGGYHGIGHEEIVFVQDKLNSPARTENWHPNAHNPSDPEGITIDKFPIPMKIASLKVLNQRPPESLSEVCEGKSEYHD